MHIKLIINEILDLSYFEKPLHIYEKIRKINLLNNDPGFTVVLVGTIFACINKKKEIEKVASFFVCHFRQLIHFMPEIVVSFLRLKCDSSHRIYYTSTKLNEKSQN